MSWHTLVLHGSLSVLSAVSIIGVVFVVLAMRLLRHGQPFELLCGPFRLRVGAASSDPSPSGATTQPSQEFEALRR